MRWRWVGGALGAVVLTAAVAILRGQVEPRVEAAAPPEPPPAAVDLPGLPVEEPVRPPRWRSYQPSRGALDGSVGVQYVLQTRTDVQTVEFTLQRRDTGERSPPYSVAQDEAPWSSLLHNGLLMVSHGIRQARLTMLDPVAPEIRELEPPDGYTFSAHLVPLGEEVFLPGHQVDPPRECVLGVTPRAGTTRVVWCAPQGRAPGWLYAGASEVVWPEFSDPPSACPQWWRVQPGGRPRPVPGQLALCGARELLTAGGGWQVTLRRERDAARPLLTATDGTHRMVLGTASTMVACGSHVYWTAPSTGDGPDVLYRWLPGSSHREVALRLESSDSRRGLTSPRCTEGVLSIGEVVGSGPRLVQLRALNRP